MKPVVLLAATIIATTLIFSCQNAPAKNHPSIQLMIECDKQMLGQEGPNHDMTLIMSDYYRKQVED